MDTSKAVLVCCVDARHHPGILEAVKQLSEYQTIAHWYLLTRPGGAGVFADLSGIYTNTGTVTDLKVLLKAGCTKIILSVHGTTADGVKGCAGYCQAGFTDHYNTATASRTFSLVQLAKAKKAVCALFPAVPVDTVYVSLDNQGQNCAEKID